MGKKKNKNEKVNLINQPMMNPEFLQSFLESSPSEGIHWIVDMLNGYIQSKWKDDLSSVDLFLITKYISDAIPVIVAENKNDEYLEEGWNKFVSMSEEEIYESTGKLLDLPINV